MKQVRPLKGLKDKDRPRPGSKDAQAAGCTCNPIINNYGRGVEQHPPTFDIRSNCPLHGSDVAS